MTGPPARHLIDAHHHVWDLTVRDQDWITGERMAPIRRSFTLDDLRPSAQAAGVEATVLVQTVTVPEETPQMLALAAADPLVAGVVGWTDLTSPAIAGELAALAAAPGGGHLVSIRHQVQSEPDSDWLRRADVIRGLRAVAAAGLCYDLVVLPNQIPAASYAASAVPGLTLVLDHAGKPPLASGDPEALGAWTTAIQEFAALPNTTCKLSGLVTEAPPGAPPEAFVPVSDVVLSAFGASRVMFGSDWPVCLLASDYAGVTALARSLVAGLSDAEQAAVFGATAARVYRLGAGKARVLSRTGLADSPAQGIPGSPQFASLDRAGPGSVSQGETRRGPARRRTLRCDCLDDRLGGATGPPRRRRSPGAPARAGRRRCGRRR